MIVLNKICDLESRHCEQSEAIQYFSQHRSGLLRFARNDDFLVNRLKNNLKFYF